MKKETKAVSKIAEIAVKVVGLLEPLESEERQKVINASLTMLGEKAQSGGSGTRDSKLDGHGTGDRDTGSRTDQGLSSLPAKAKNWANQNQLTMTQIEQVYDVAQEGVSVIAAEAPGGSDKEKTHNAYVLQGIGRLLATGDPIFEDKDARSLCENLGCYNSANHSTYMADKGNMLTGSKKTGWKLTAPGLKHGAELVKQLTNKD